MFARLPLHALIVASTLLAGCGQGLGVAPTAAVQTGAVKAASVAARPSLEDALAAAKAVASRQGARANDLLFVHGNGVGPDGRLLAGDQAWMGGEAQWSFSFKRGGSLGSEDFALVAEKVPSFQLGIGASQEGRNDKLHNSDYQPDERSIKNGVVALSLAAIRILS